MGKNRNKLHYVRGVCELEKGDVYFEGGMSGVSGLQVWYYVIYAIKDKFKEIDFWIDPKMERCETLPSTSNYLRYGKCQKFVCEYKPFPEGVVKPKRKLSDLDKKKYAENRAKVDLGVKVELREPKFDLREGDIVFDEPTLDEGGNKVEYVPTEPIEPNGVERVPYRVRSKVMMLDGKVKFMASPYEKFNYTELQDKLKLYSNCKEVMKDCIKGFKELGDEVISHRISSVELDATLGILRGTFISKLNEAKSNCREIDLYTLCKDVGSFGLEYLQDIVSKSDMVVDVFYVSAYGSGAFIKLSNLYNKLSGLLLLVTDIFMAIETEASKNTVNIAKEDEIVF